MLVGICAFLFLGSKRKNYFVNERPVPGLIIFPRLCPIKENHKQEKKYTREEVYYIGLNALALLEQDIKKNNL